MSNLLVVAISDYKYSKNPDVIVTYALGSCVGICLFDEAARIGGMAHIMLPDSKQFTSERVNRMKFADTAIPDLVGHLKRSGANPARLIAKIAGGAQMFKVQEGSPLGDIGKRNTLSTKAVLSGLRIPIVGEDTGADYGRTIYFDLATGALKVQALNRMIKML